MQNQKLSSPYSLVKQPLVKTKGYSIYDARNKKSNQIWLAKVFHGTVLQQLSMEDHVAYNQQVLDNLKEKAHIVYVQEIFSKGNDTFLIQQKYETKLSDYLSKQLTLQPAEIVRILQDTFQGISDIYEQRYVHANLRSEHIVKIAGEGPDEYLWKIDCVVLDSKQFPIETPFTWRRQTASPEDKNKQKELNQQLQDAQIVWNFGYLAMEMLMGTYFLTKKITKESDVSWAKIKEQTNGFPDLFQLINSCFRFNYKDRVPLKRFFDLKIFSDVVKPGIQGYFMTASKIFKASTLSSFQSSYNLKSKSRNMNSINLKSKLAVKQPTSQTYFNNLQEVQQQIYDEQGQKDINRYCFLMQVSNYLNLIQAESEPKQLQNRIIIEYFMLRLATLVEARIKPGSLNHKIKNLAQQHSSKIKNHSNAIRRIKWSENALALKFGLDFKKEYNNDELVTVCNKLCGYAYSRLREECEKVEEPNKLKAMAYFTLVPYFVNVSEWRLIDDSIASNKDYLQVFKKTDLNAMVILSQKIIKQHFQVSAS